jgi:hypothetical protein
MIRARTEPGLVARVVSRRALLYTRGADVALDRPAHVRAGSALASLGAGRLAVIQDDASFLALVDLASGRVDDVPFPASPNGERQFDDLRGNKKRKLDLEATLALGDGSVVAFGSGSSDLRERVVLVHEGRVDVVEATALYAEMRAARSFSGSELNVEGAALDQDDVVFFQRGNGAGEAVDATARVDAKALFAWLRGGGPCPPLRAIVQWDLGTTAGGVRLTFTDGARSPNGLAFLACAEDCPDATRDGPVTGVCIGRLDDAAEKCEIADVLGEDGAPLLDKAEGLAFVDSRRAYVVIDKDDPALPSELLELSLGAAWQT